MGVRDQDQRDLSLLRRTLVQCRGHVASFLRFDFPALGRRCAICGILATLDDPGCSAALDLQNGLQGACATCRAELGQRTEGFCPRCGLLLDDCAKPTALCLDCRVSPPPWDGVFFYGPYEGRLKALVVRFKFQAQLGLGEVLRALLLRSLEFHDAPGHDLIIPVPLHPRRLRHRGFNQSLELARGLVRGESGSRYGRLAPHALTRVRDTPPQHTLPRAARMQNLTGAFQADPAMVQGRSVLLVDDILTTGSTLRAATRELKRSGATRINLLVLARA